MRACDHKAIQICKSWNSSTGSAEAVLQYSAYYWYMGASQTGPTFTVPAASVLPLMDPNLDRCKARAAGD